MIWTYNQNNELGGYDNVSFVYDTNGNLTNKTNGTDETNYIYNVEDRLVRVEDGTGTVIAEYYYDPFGRRLWKEVDGVRTYFLYSDEGLIGEYNSSGQEIRSYGYKPGSNWGTDVLFVKEVDNYYFYQNDHLGTPQKITGINGSIVWEAKYSSFGEAQVSAASTITNNLRFPGQYYDQETGLYYNYHRYYHSDTGRYLRADPLTKGYDISRQEHTYTYTMNNPIVFTDPVGLAATCTYTYSSKWFVPGKGYLGRLKCTFTNTSGDPKCCGEFVALAYTGRGDKRRLTSQEFGPIPTGTWHIANVGSLEDYPNFPWLLAREGVKRYPDRDYNDFLMHGFDPAGSEGCIALISRYPDIKPCLEAEHNTGPGNYTLGTLEVKIQ